MNPITFQLTDYSFLRRIKPIQNICLLIIFNILITYLIIVYFEINFLQNLAAFILLISIILFVLFLLLTISNLYKKKNGLLVLTDNQINISNDVYELSNIQFIINIDQTEWLNKSKLIDKKINSLPKWGNYIVLESGKKIEFEPNENLNKIIEKINVEGYHKRPFLLVKTSDLFNSLASTLWAAS